MIHLSSADCAIISHYLRYFNLVQTGVCVCLVFEYVWYLLKCRWQASTYWICVMCLV